MLSLQHWLYAVIFGQLWLLLNDANKKSLWNKWLLSASADVDSWEWIRSGITTHLRAWNKQLPSRSSCCNHFMPVFITRHWHSRSWP